MAKQGQTVAAEQMLFDFGESEIEKHIAQTVAPQAAVFIAERKEYLAAHESDPENFVSIPAPESYRAFGGWSGFNERLATSERIRINRQATELLQREDKNYSESELSILRRYSGFGGLDTSGERGVLYDFYTSPPVANMTWQLLHKIQPVRKNSHILEPSCGTGVFFETAPEGVNLHGVELDQRAAAVSSALFPDASVKQTSFEGYYASEDNNRKYNHVIGNVPFGERTIQTAFLDLPEEKNLDRYFLKRSIDLLAENGTLALITHPGVLENSSSRDFRMKLISTAQFMGAVKLNDRTFHHTHTSVQPVIVFFKKYPDDIAQRIASHPDSAIIDELYQGIPYSAFIEGTYFEENPRHVMGEVDAGTGQWGADVVKGDTGQSTLRAMVEAFTPYQQVGEDDFAAIRKSYDIAYKKELEDSLALSKQELDAVQNKTLTAGALKTTESAVYLLSGEYRWGLIESSQPSLAAKLKQANLICGQVRALRAAMRQGGKPAEKQKETAASLEQYRQAHGQYPLDDTEIKSFLRRHPAVKGVYDSFITPNSDIVTQANIFENRNRRLDGYAMSIGVLKYFQENLTDCTEEKLKQYYPDEYGGIIEEMYQNNDVFLTYNKIWQLREDFISGNAWNKTDFLQDALKSETDSAVTEKWRHGITELEKAAGWVPVEDAQFTPHSSWIPEYIINEWIADKEGLGNTSLVNGDQRVSKNDTGKWGVRYQTSKTVVASDYAVKERYEGQWDEAADPVIYYLNMQKQRSKYIDTETFNRDTNGLFKSWASGHPRYREALEQKYNRIFNAEIGVPVKTYPVYIDGWLPDSKTPKPHQLQSVYHLYTGQKGISALGTGFGKTLAGITLAALLQQEHKITRAFFQVPNNKVKDWAAEFKAVLPGKKVGFIDPETRGYFSRELRYTQYQNLINNRYDIIIMPESSASEIQLSPEADQEITERVVNGQLMNAAAGKSQRKAETMKESASRKLRNGKTNKVIYFEDFGCDAVFVDEAHRYKNLFSSRAGGVHRHKHGLKGAAVQIFIQNQKEYDEAVKNNRHTGNELVIRNCSEFVSVHTSVTVAKNGRCKTGGGGPVTITVKEDGKVAAEGKTVIAGYDNAHVIAKGNCKVTLHDDAVGNIYNNCHVTLLGKAKASAADNCTVHAHDESGVSAFGNSKIYTYQKAVASGTDVASLTGKDSSTLTGEKKCSINAQDNCLVFATDDCTVKAADNCLIIANKNANVVSQNNCVVMSNDSPNINLLDQSEHFNIDTITDKNIMGCLKRLSKSKAFMERPYISLQLLMAHIPPAQKEAVSRRLATMGCKDQVSTKNFLYNLIEVDSPRQRHGGRHHPKQPASGYMER